MRPHTEINNISEEQLAYCRRIHRVKIYLWMEIDSTYCFHVIFKYIGKFIVDLQTNIDVAEFAGTLTLLTTLQLDDSTALDVRAIPSLKHVIIRDCQVSLQCTNLESVTLYRAHITVRESRSITSLFMHKMQYQYLFPDKSFTTPFTNINFFTKPLTLNDTKAFLSTTYVILFQEGNYDYSKIIIFDRL
jgi:hypothetical protein